MARVKKAVRWGLVALVALLVLLGIGAGVVYYLVSRLDIRAEIERHVEQATGRDLTISGDVGVSLWPVIGLEAHDAALANVEGGRAPALASMQEIRVGVEIAPLFRREVAVRRLVLHNPRIALEVDAQGQPNWILRPVPREGAPAPSGEQAAFSLRNVTIHDGEVSFFDARRNAAWSVTDADLRTALRSMDEPVRVEGGVTYAGERFDLDGEIAEPRAMTSGRPTAVKLDVESAVLNANFDGHTTAASGELSGLIRASGPSLRRLSALAGVPITGGVGLERFAVSGRIALGGGRFDFSNAGFSLDQIRGRGDFVLMESRGKPYVSGRLELFDFDLNPYLSGVQPPQDELAPGGDGAPAGAAGEQATRAQIATVEAAPRAVDVAEAARDTPIDFSALRAINADLELTTAKFLVQHMQIDSARMNMVLNDGYLAASLHQMALYGGTGAGRMEVDAREDVVRIEQDMNFSGVDALRFLSDAANVQNIEGRADLSVRLTTRGRSQSDFIGSSDGRAHIEVVSGALRGVDLGGVARTIRNALSGDLVSPNARTPFLGFSATFAVSDGVLASENLSFNTEQLRISGLAVIDLPQRRMDARLAPRSPGGGGIVIPFSVRGPLGQLGYDSDIRDRALREIQARVDQVQAAP